MSLDIRAAHRLVEKKVPAPSTQTFTASGTWTKPVGAVRIVVEAWGAGGGGGKGSYRVGGGGGGSHSMRVFDPSELPASVAVTVGAGGAPGTSTGQYSWVPGGTGGDSSFGSYVVGKGGGGGMATGDSTNVNQYEGYLMGAPGGILSYQEYNGHGGPGMVPRVNNSPMDGHHLGGSGAGNYTGTGTNPWLNNARAGDSVYGGGGGANGNTSTSRAGTSVYGGAGGTSVYDGSTGNVGGDGQAPGGGGGVGSGPYVSGNGARGEVRVTTYYA